MPGEVRLHVEVLVLPRDGRGVQRLHEGEAGHGDAAFRVPRSGQGPPVRQVSTRVRRFAIHQLLSSVQF